MARSCNLALFIIVFSQWAWQAQASSASKTDYYSIIGSTLSELRSQMQQKGPNGFWAFTRYNISYDYKTRQSNNGCLLSGSNIDIETTITMPKWKNILAAPIAMQQDWKIFYDATWLHEQGHKAIGQSMHSRLGREFNQARRQKNCADFTGVLANIYSLADIEANSKNVEYDARTNYGVNEGVVLGSAARTSSDQTASQQDSSFSKRSAIAWYWWFIVVIGLLLFLER